MQPRRSRISALGIILTILLGVACSRGAEPDASIAEALAWVETLGLPAIKDCPFVRVATGSWIKTGNQPPRNRFCHGFLTKDEGAEFRVYVHGIPGDEDAFPYSSGCWPLAVMTFGKKPAGPEHERVGYEVLDLKMESAALLERLRLPQWDRLPRHYAERGRMDERAAVFLFARDCLKSGLPEIANALMARAAAMPAAREGQPSLRAALEEDIGLMRMSKAEADMGDPKVSRRELLASFERIARLFPACSEAKRAKEHGDVLRQMVAEDEAHHPKPFGQMTPREKVAEWIFQLRDQTGFDNDMSGNEPLLGLDEREGDRGDTPGQQLVKTGYDAVPQLIEAIGDPRFSRAVHISSHHRLSYSPLRIGDCVHLILEKIADRNFGLGRGIPGEKARDGEIAESRKEIGAWWKELRKKGTKTLMIEAVRRGESDSPELARKLMEKYPADALAAIIAGARAAKDSSTRGYLVAAAAAIPGDAPVKFLRAEMKEASRGVRVCAAIALFRRGQPGVVEAMIEDWERLRPNLRTNQNDEYHQAGDVIGFLAACGKPEAVNALARDFRGEPLEVRLAIAWALAPEAHGRSLGASGQSISRSSCPLDLPAPPEIDPAAERLLISALDDTEARHGMKGTWEDATFSDPRICDVAAFVLTKRWPGKYAFRWETSREDRDIQLVKSRNVWREGQGQTPLPVPARTGVAPATEAEIAPLLEKLIAAPDAAQRDAAASTIEKTVGLRALPAVRSRLTRLADAPTTTAALRALAKRVASQVRAVQPGPATLDADLKKQLDGLRGEPLDSGHLEKVLILLAGKLPPKTKGFTFIAERAEPDSGFVISIEWIAGLPQDPKAGWSSFERVLLGEKDLHNSSSWNAEGRDAVPARYSDMREALTKALAAESDAPISVHFRAVRQRND